MDTTEISIHQATIVIDMQFHGIIDRLEFTGDIDQSYRQVIDFFKKISDKGMEKYENERLLKLEQLRQERIEAEERETLKRLKAKYESATNDKTT